MFATSIASWSTAPSRIAVHFGIRREPDRYGGKIEGLLLVPIIAAVVYVGGYLLQNVVAAKPQIAASYILFTYAYLITLGATYAVIYLTMRGIKLSLGTLIVPALAFDAFVFIDFSVASNFGITRLERATNRSATLLTSR